MWFLKRWPTFVLLFLTTFSNVKGRLDLLAELNSQLENKGILNERTGNTTSNVIFNNKHHEIYINEPEREYFNTLTKTYVYLNCEVAEGVRDRLINKIEFLPLLYHKDFMFVPDKSFKTYLTTLGILNEFVDYAENWIGVLMNIFNIHLVNNDSSNNTDILRTLLSFCYKIKSLQSYEEVILSLEQIDVTVLANFLELLYSIQKYIFLNCHVSYYDGKRKSYGLTLSESDRNDDDLNTFLSVLQTLEIGRYGYCNANRMAMEDKISWRYGSIKWKTNYGTISYRFVNISLNVIFMDLEFIFWYQHYMFETIVKLTISKTLDHYKDNMQIPNKIADKLKQFVTQMLEIKNSPSNTINCLTLLTERNFDIVYNANDVFSKTISSCLQSLSHVILKDAPDKESSHAGFESVGDHLNSLPISTLEELIDYFGNIAPEFECFLRLYQFLSNEFNAYNVSHAQRSEKIGNLEWELTESIYNSREEIENAKDKDDESKENPTNTKKARKDAVKEKSKISKNSKNNKFMRANIESKTKNNKSKKGNVGGKNKNTKHSKSGVTERKKIADEEQDKKEDVEEKKVYDEEGDLIQHGCNYFSGLYNFCFESMMFLNMSFSRTYDDNVKRKYSDRVKNILKRVTNFLNVLTDGYFNVPQFEVLYKVLPLLELIQIEKFTNNYDDTKRLISAVMTDLNIYGAEFCSPPDYNFSFVNNIDFSVMGWGSKITAIIESSMKFLKKITNQGCTYISIRELFGEFDKKLSAFSRYNSVILLNWRGQKMNIVDIHNAVAYSLTDSSSLYFMYDNYIKFSLVVVYFEIYRSYQFQNGEINENNRLRFDSWDKKYSSRYEGIIKNITAFSKRRTDEGESYEVVGLRLIDQFRRIGVSIDVDHLSSDTGDRNTQENIDNIFSFAESVNRNFSRNCVHGGKRIIDEFKIHIK